MILFIYALTKKLKVKTKYFFLNFNIFYYNIYFILIDLMKDPWFYDIKLGENACRSLMKDICIAVGIDINGRDIVNHSGRSTPITFLFQKGVPTVTTMSITGHKSESSYRIYARPSNQQREDALSLLIDNVGLVRT